MDPGLLIAKAVANGVIGSDQAETMTPPQALMLVCAPGFSTAEAVSDISGRGVGMDAVRNAVHNLGGALAIESETGLGSRFILKLPCAVSIINALLVRCGALTVAFPVNAVDRALELGQSDIIEEGEDKACILATRSIPLKSLNRLLGQPMPGDRAHSLPVVVTGMGGTPAGLLTDRILGQQEIFVKPLGLPLSRLCGITGGAILGDGRIVFVMDINAFAYATSNKQDARPKQQ
jgi:two-component system chemotaxis sensor kinase CheA